MMLAEQIELACVLEATARKPGNVHPGASFDDLCYDDFVKAAAASAPILSRAHELGIGLADRLAQQGRQLRFVHPVGAAGHHQDGAPGRPGAEHQRLRDLGHRATDRRRGVRRGPGRGGESLDLGLDSQGRQSRPDAIDVTRRPPMSGTIWRPATVGLFPLTTW